MTQKEKGFDCTTYLQVSDYDVTISYSIEFLILSQNFPQNEIKEEEIQEENV